MSTILESLSAPFSKALAPERLNSYKEVFVDLDMRIEEPGTKADSTNPDDIGVHRIGYEGAASVQQLLILPFAQSEPGSEFWMRVYGWRWTGMADGLWIPTLLAELSCRTCMRPGVGVPGIGTGPRLIAANELACDTIAATAGYAAVVAPGRNLIAWFTVPTFGCQKVQFDFMIGEELPCFPNALWARA